MRRLATIATLSMIFTGCEAERGPRRGNPVVYDPDAQGEGEGEGGGQGEGEGEGPGEGEGEGEGPTKCDANSGDPDADPMQLRACSLINGLRRKAGMPLVRFDPALNRAAQAHADYFEVNFPESREDSHGEKPDGEGFTGRNPGTRAEASGYEGPMMISEDMAFSGSAAESVMSWYDSVFHRVPIVHPDAVLIGFGHARRVEVLDVATDRREQRDLARTPYDGAEGVPRSFYSDYEGPDPVPDANLVGYPVSIVTNRRDVALVEGSIVPDDGEPYDLWIAAADEPVPGFLPHSIFLMSKVTLLDDTWHTVTIDYLSENKMNKEVWRFRTGAR